MLPINRKKNQPVHRIMVKQQADGQAPKIRLHTDDKVIHKLPFHLSSEMPFREPIPFDSNLLVSMGGLKRPGLVSTFIRF